MFRENVARIVWSSAVLLALAAPRIAFAQLPLTSTLQRTQAAEPRQEVTQEKSQANTPSQNVPRQTTPQLTQQALESLSRALGQTGTIQDIEQRLKALEERPKVEVAAPATREEQSSLLKNLQGWFRRWWLWGLFWGFLWWIPWLVFSWQWWRRRFWVFWWPWPWWWWIPWFWFIPWLLWAWWWPLCFWFWWCWLWWWIPWIFWIPWWLIVLKHVLQWLHAKKP